MTLMVNRPNERRHIFQDFYENANENLFTDLRMTAAEDGIKKVFNVHSGLLKHFHPEFDTSIGQAKDIVLCDVSSKVVGCFVELLYTGNTDIGTNDNYWELMNLCRIFNVSSRKISVPWASEVRKDKPRPKSRSLKRHPRVKKEVILSYEDASNVEVVDVEEDLASETENVNPTTEGPTNAEENRDEIPVQSEGDDIEKILMEAYEPGSNPNSSSLFVEPRTSETNNIESTNQEQDLVKEPEVGKEIKEQDLVKEPEVRKEGKEKATDPVENEASEFVCTSFENCNKICSSQKNLKKHQATHLKESIFKKFNLEPNEKNCPLCNKKFEMESTLNRHLAFTHKEMQYYMENLEKAEAEGKKRDQSPKVSPIKGLFQVSEIDGKTSTPIKIKLKVRVPSKGKSDQNPETIENEYLETEMSKTLGKIEKENPSKEMSKTPGKNEKESSTKFVCSRKKDNFETQWICHFYPCNL